MIQANAVLFLSVGAWPLLVHALEAAAYTVLLVATVVKESPIILAVSLWFAFYLSLSPFLSLALSLSLLSVSLSIPLMGGIYCFQLC